MRSYWLLKGAAALFVGLPQQLGFESRDFLLIMIMRRGRSEVCCVILATISWDVLLTKLRPSKRLLTI